LTVSLENESVYYDGAKAKTSVENGSVIQKLNACRTSALLPVHLHLHCGPHDAEG